MNLKMKKKGELENISENLYGEIEAGDTKFICAIGTLSGNLVAKEKFPTTTPIETLNRAVEFFKWHSYSQQLATIGIAYFGPLDLNTSSMTFGYITSTPKSEWSNTNILGKIETALNVPVAIDTDVNGAALGEHRFGNAKDTDNFIYLTIGTGICGGGMINGKLMHGFL